MGHLTAPVEQVDPARAGSAPERKTLGERYRGMFNRRAVDWWSIVFGYPVGRLLLVPVAELRWITPNVLTAIGFLVSIGAAAVYCWGESRLDMVCGALLMQVAAIMDAMDGSLARHRRSFSRLGAFFDKISDGFTLFALCVAIGIRAFGDSGNPWHVALACGGGGSYLVLCYMYWVAKATAPRAMAPAAVAGLAEVPSWGGIGREWLRGWLKMFKFEQADMYFWIPLFALLDQWVWLAYLLGVSQFATVMYKLVEHTTRLAREADEGA